MLEKIKPWLNWILERFRFSAQKLTNWTKRQPLWRLAAIGIGGPFLFLCLFVGLMWMGTRMGWYGELPSEEALQEIENDQAAEVYAADDVMLGKYFIENRTSVPLNSISPYVVQALIATEDARFFEHQGIDLRALGRVLWRSIIRRDRSGGGGSTLSQQLAKNLYPRRSFRQLGMLKNKLREMTIANRLESVYNKEELLQLYLNTVPFGENVFGIQVAAQRFFNCQAADLRAEQAAVLVGLLKANTSYNPRLHPEASRRRRDLVLRLLADNNFLTVQERDSLQNLDLELDYRPESENQGLATYFRDHLRLEVEDILSDFRRSDGEPYDLYRDGLRIYTTIDSRLQSLAETAIAEEMPRLQQSLAEDWSSARAAPWEDEFMGYVRSSEAYRHQTEAGKSDEEAIEALRQERRMTIFDWKEGGAVDTTLRSIDSLRHYFVLMHAGLLASEANTGIIRAWVGGINHRFTPYDHVKSRRQIGSTIKPLVYATALEGGMLPCEYTPAERFSLEDYNNYDPSNPNGDYNGVYSMRGGLSKSINTVAVNIAVRSGLDTVEMMVNRFGIDQGVSPIPSLALGTAEANLIEMNQAYSAFANGGRLPMRLHYLDRIETANGDTIVLFERPSPGIDFDRVLTEDIAKLTTFLMSGVVNSGTAARLRTRYGLRGALAGKTGTTQNQSDGWFVGFNPKLVVSTWVGASYPAVHFRSLRRGSATQTALPIWGNFMRQLMRTPDLGPYRGGSFSSLDEMTMALLQCPDYLDELPVIGYDSSLLAREVTPQQLEELMLRKPQRRNESSVDYLRRIERELQRVQRREERADRRREFWSNTLFGKKNKEGGQ